MAEWTQAVQWIEHRLERVFASLKRELESLEQGRAWKLPATAETEPAPWTPWEIAEHVTLANRYLLILVQKIATKSERRLAQIPNDERASPDPPSTTPLERLGRRDFAWAHPEHMTPTGTMPSAAVCAQLDEDLARARAFLVQMPRGEGSLHTIRMSVLGGDNRLDLYGYLTLIAVHAERHLAQLTSRLA